MRPSTSKINFNSIKVRLKLTCVGNNDLMDVFQFHKGTIKTHVATLYGIMATYFNSIKVGLKQIDGKIV